MRGVGRGTQKLKFIMSEQNIQEPENYRKQSILSTVLYGIPLRIMAIIYVVALTIIGCFLIPFIIWVTDNGEVSLILLFISCILLLLCITCTALPILQKRINTKIIKVFITLLSPILISSLITFIRFSYNTRSCENYMSFNNNLHTKFGILVTKGRYKNWCWGYEDGDKVFINYMYINGQAFEDYKCPTFHYEVYDAEVNFIRHEKEIISEENSTSAEKLKELFTIYR